MPTQIGVNPDGTPKYLDENTTGSNAGQQPNTADPVDPSDPYVPDPDLDQYGYQTGVNGEKNFDINVGMTGGLMDTVSAIENSPYANSNYNARIGQADAVNRGVGQEELSQYQLQQMLASDSPLMKQAAAQGLARGGSRGLMNSSLSTGAAQGAMIKNAQPFALQDASAYGRTASENMSATNDALKLNAQLKTQGGIADMQAGAARDRQILADQMTGYGDIRKAMIGIEDREDTQGYNSWQNQLNRDWTSNENMLTNSLSWAESQLDSATKYGVTREQAFADMYSSIMNNPNPKFKADQRAQAVRNLQATMNAAYPDSPPGVFEGSYDPATGQFTEPPPPPPGSEAENNHATDGSVPPGWWPGTQPWYGYAGYAGSTGGIEGVTQNYDSNYPSASNPENQQWGSNQSPDIGKEGAQLPGVVP